MIGAIRERRMCGMRLIIEGGERRGGEAEAAGAARR